MARKSSDSLALVTLAAVTTALATAEMAAVVDEGQNRDQWRDAARAAPDSRHHSCSHGLDSADQLSREARSLLDEQVCESEWVPTFGARPGVESQVRAMTVFDDGTGPALYVGGSFQVAGGVTVTKIARWDGSEWSALGGGIHTNFNVHALAVFDDGLGGGPALYVGGSFPSASNVPGTSRIARWDGQQWTALDAGVNDSVWSLGIFDDGSGPALYAAGDFTAAGDVEADRIAKWDGMQWSNLGTGLDARAFALVAFDDGSGTSLFAGGEFTTAGGVEASRIARWDGQEWFALTGGMNNSVSTLAVFDDGDGDALFAGGAFTEAGEVDANRIAKWDGNEWSTLGVGTNNHVRDLVVHDDGTGPALFACGTFSFAGGNQAARIARWDGEAWSSLPSGLNNTAFAMAVYDDGLGDGSVLFVGGLFTAADSKLMNRVTRWNGQYWMPLGGGFNNTVRAMTIFDDGDGPAVYVAGEMTWADGQPINRVAKWDGEQWHALDTGILNGWVSALAEFDDGSGPALFAGGFFAEAGGVPANRIAKWDGEQWHALDTGILNGWVSALAEFDDGSGPALYVGGQFILGTDEGLAIRIARWDGQQWSPLGDGLGGPQNTEVRSLTVFDDGSGDGPSLYAGGVFDLSGSTVVNNIARWNPDSQTWSALGDAGAEGTNGGVSALTVFNDGLGGGSALYAGGQFTTAGGEDANRIARWKGEVHGWSPLGDGTNNDVHALTVVNEGLTCEQTLVAVGNFTAAGSIPASRMARWDGQAWSNLSSEINWHVHTVMAIDDDTGEGQWLYAGGEFWLSDSGDSFLARFRICTDGEIIPADLNCDGVVDVSDLLVLLAAWGPCPRSADCPADLNGDGVVDVSDLLILLANWG